MYDTHRDVSAKCITSKTDFPPLNENIATGHLHLQIMFNSPSIE